MLRLNECHSCFFSGDRMPSMHPQEMQTAILEMKAIPEA